MSVKRRIYLELIDRDMIKTYLILTKFNYLYYFYKMRKKIALLILNLIFFNSLYSQELPSIDIGEPFPASVIDHPMQSIDSKQYRVSQFLKKNGLIIIFTSNSCPFVDAWEDRYKIIENLCQRYNLDMVYINSNHNRRDGKDSFKAMQEHAKKMGYTFNYLLDEESELANTLGAKTTPHVFMFDKLSKLIYKGAIDDNYESISLVKTFYLKDAIQSHALGNEIEISETKAIGCSIKRYNPQ